MISFKKLRVLLAEKEIKSSNLAKELKISPNVMANMNKDKYVSLRIIDDICNYLNCDISDIVEHIKDEKKELENNKEEGENNN